MDLLGDNIMSIVKEYIENTQFDSVLGEMRADWKWNIRNNSDSRSFMDRITSLMENHEIFADVMEDKRHTNFSFSFGGFLF
jgi:hypothetical protein